MGAPRAPESSQQDVALMAWVYQKRLEHELGSPPNHTYRQTLKKEKQVTSHRERKRERYRKKSYEEETHET